MKKEINNFLKKFWHLLFKDDSLTGWVLSIIILFVLIKFIFFPVLSLVTGTMLPLAIVESCSMYHEGNTFSDNDAWWDHWDNKYEAFGLNKETFSEFIFQDGFNKGDILFILGVKPENVKIGDVIIFQANQRNPIIHRVVGIKEKDGERIFSTIGDNNKAQLSFENNISGDQIVGKAITKLAPYAGWVKLVFFEKSRNDHERGFCSAN